MNENLKFHFWLRVWRAWLRVCGCGLFLNNGVALNAKGVKSVTLK
ncbi:hypothetical protein [Candidatus Campylobacter infans]|nr:hypothetical protein [Candidatus Campylobacter infans]